MRLQPLAEGNHSLPAVRSTRKRRLLTFGHGGEQHLKKTQLARQLIEQVKRWLPDKPVEVVARDVATPRSPSGEPGFSFPADAASASALRSSEPSPHIGRPGAPAQVPGVTLEGDLDPLPRDTFVQYAETGITGGFLWNSGTIFGGESGGTPTPRDYANAISSGLSTPLVLRPGKVAG